jgi:hypothetical protein
MKQIIYFSDSFSQGGGIGANGILEDLKASSIHT